jgi:hypothetical protein
MSAGQLRRIGKLTGGISKATDFISPIARYWPAICPKEPSRGCSSGETGGPQKTARQRDAQGHSGRYDPTLLSGNGMDTPSRRSLSAPPKTYSKWNRARSIRRFTGLTTVDRFLHTVVRALWAHNFFLTLTSFGRDTKYALRTLSRTPGFSVIAISGMALCIDTATSLLTIVRSVSPEPRRPEPRPPPASQSPEVNLTGRYFEASCGISLDSSPVLGSAGRPRLS